MRSGTSFFDLTIYRKTLTRFWPLWTINLVIWLFALPFDGLMTLADHLDGGRTGNAMLRFARGVGDFATELGVIFALVAGLAVAMAVCSHLYNNRSANFMGALPIRREGQFASSYLAGLTMLIGPNLLIFLLTLLVEAAGGAVLWLPLLFWLGAVCAMEFFFYSFAVCLGQFTGHILALPIYYGIFNAIVVAVYSLLGWVMNAYYYGFSGLDLEGNMVVWCTPVAALSKMDINVVGVDGVWVTDIEGLWIAGVYAIVALVLAVCALLLYRRRHLETASDIVSVKVMRPVFKYGVAACSGLFFGFLTSELLGFGELGLMFAVIVWGIVGYFVAQMLLDKSIRVFRKWKGAAAITAAFLVLFAVIGFDLTGYETRVPAADQVQSVQIDGLQGYPYDSGAYLNVEVTDPEVIADVVALHQDIVEFGEEGEPDASGDYNNWNNVNLNYTLKSGKILSRRYSFPMGERLTALAQALMDNDSVRWNAYELDVLESWRAQGAQLEVACVYQEGGAVAEHWGADAAKLWDAVMADFEAGNIGIHTMDTAEYHAVRDEFILGGERIGIHCDLEFRWAMERTGDNTGVPEAGVTLDIPGETATETIPYESKDMKYWYMQIAVLDRSEHTLAALAELEAAEQPSGT